METSGNAGGSFVGRDAPGTSRIVVDEERRVIVGATITGSEVAEALHAATIAVVGGGVAGRPLARGAVVPDAERAVAEAARGVRPLTTAFSRSEVARHVLAPVRLTESPEWNLEAG